MFKKLRRNLMIRLWIRWMHLLVRGAVVLYLHYHIGQVR